MLKQSSSGMKKVMAVLLPVLFVVSLIAVPAVAADDKHHVHVGHRGINNQHIFEGVNRQASIQHRVNYHDIHGGLNKPKGLSSVKTLWNCGERCY